ncbi:MlaA family lipoprotein [Neisseria canis]|uniref:Putative VacJ-like protein n=1 Tax=Neisseria canis TaxID=493 RepID=A0A1X3CVM9_9NEIS|nr:VacJ family lipoprotein [Neisseria canis]OSI11670.1 ABC transporter [Neisseria canis]VEF00126.1 putative VacJ-like protein [Neisseria canis]
MNKHQTAVLASLLLALSAPASAEHNPHDPYEGYNRFMFKVNDVADRYVMTPVAKGYRAVTPKPVRTGVSNFFNNLRDVASFGSNVLRLDIKRASEDLVRVGVNTTFGVGGLIDVAGAGGVPNNKNTLGDTFASWGWKNSNYFVYPLTGPSTVRDALGSTITTAALPVDNYIFKDTGVRIGEKALNAVNQREQYLDLTASLDEAAIDKYAAVRDVYMSMRAKQLGIAPPQAGEEIDIDDLVTDDAPGAEPAVATENVEAENMSVVPRQTDAPASVIQLKNGETVSISDYVPAQ